MFVPYILILCNLRVMLLVLSQDLLSLSLYISWTGWQIIEHPRISFVCGLHQARALVLWVKYLILSWLLFLFVRYHV
jgi:hypothetical protein